MYDTGVSYEAQCMGRSSGGLLCHTLIRRKPRYNIYIDF